MTFGKPRSLAFGVFRGMALAILLVLVLPYLITPFYLVVNPVSTLMLWRWAKRAPVVRSWVPLRTIAPPLPLSVIVAAARKAFGKSARELNAREAAALAAILPNPILRSAGRPGAGVRRLAGIYEGRARKSPDLAACVRR